MNPEKAERLSPELQKALEPRLAASAALSEQIAEYNERIEQLAKESYPQVALLKQVKGVGTLIALTFLLTLEDPHRFQKSRDVGCYLGLQPGRRNSGTRAAELRFAGRPGAAVPTLFCLVRLFGGGGCVWGVYFLGGVRRDWRRLEVAYIFARHG